MVDNGNRSANISVHSDSWSKTVLTKIVSAQGFVFVTVTDKSIAWHLQATKSVCSQKHAVYVGFAYYLISFGKNNYPSIGMQQ